MADELSTLHIEVPDDTGIEQEDKDDLKPERLTKDAREKKKTLLDLSPGAVAKYIRGRYHRQDETWRKRQVQLKVNHLRYKGWAFAQPNPRDPNSVYVPRGSGRVPPTVNKIRRTVQRYQAQVTADEPVIEGVPAVHTDDARDAAEAATHLLRGEWFRMHLNRVLQRTVLLSGIFRSAFWLFQWNPHVTKERAQKYFTDPASGDRYLAFVDSDGNEVDEPEDAALIWRGETEVEVLTPFNVRWSGGHYAHEADEVMVAKLVSLGKLYEAYPETRKVKIRTLLDGKPEEAEKWLENIRGAEGAFAPEQGDADFSDAELDQTGDDLDGAGSSLLDEKVFLLLYYKNKSFQYPEGVEAVVAGKHMVRRGKLRYGVIPVVHFKLLDETDDPLGLSLVDLLKDPQELLDFVNGQILRYLQSLKKQYLVPMNSGIKPSDLLNPHRAFIPYNPTAGEPKPMEHADIPSSLSEWVDRFDSEFDDMSGIHDTMQGKHVPGVSSGRHAEALRSGDETILGLTRTQIQEGLEAGGRVLLAISKKEWTTARTVEYIGEGRAYVEQALSNTDFGETSRVRLNQATLLMLTPAQKLETIFGYAEAGALTTQELRRLAPLGDTAGISLSEDDHYKRARRQNSKFLAGPPEELVRIRESFEERTASNTRQIAALQTAIAGRRVADPDGVEAAVQTIEMDTQLVEQEWAEDLARFTPQHEEWENDPAIAAVHFTEHARALSNQKVARFPDWWVEPFVQHAMIEWQMANGAAIQEAAQQQAQQAAAQAPNVDTAPAGMEFGTDSAPPVTGAPQ